MSFFKSIADLKSQAKEIDRDWDPAAHMRQATSRMAAAQTAMTDMTRAAAVAQSGLGATATIAAARPTAGQLNFEPIIELDVMVFADGRPPYPVTFSQPIAAIHLAKVQPGASLPAKIDRQNPSSIWLDLAGTR